MKITGEIKEGNVVAFCCDNNRAYELDTGIVHSVKYKTLWETIGTISDAERDELLADLPRYQKKKYERKVFKAACEAVDWGCCNSDNLRSLADKYDLPTSAVKDIAECAREIVAESYIE